jgi:hypothetical protein
LRWLDRRFFSLAAQPEAVEGPYQQGQGKIRQGEAEADAQRIIEKGFRDFVLEIIG